MATKHSSDFRLVVFIRYWAFARWTDPRALAASRSPKLNRGNARGGGRTKRPAIRRARYIRRGVAAHAGACRAARGLDACCVHSIPTRKRTSAQVLHHESAQQPHRAWMTTIPPATFAPPAFHNHSAVASKFRRLRTKRRPHISIRRPTDSPSGLRKTLPHEEQAKLRDAPTLHDFCMAATDLARCLPVVAT